MLKATIALPVITKKSIEKNKDLNFINVIRFLSIIGIVSLHCFILPTNVAYSEFLHRIKFPGIYIAFVNLFRFSVISLCIISGYLADAKIGNKTFEFFSNKLRSIVAPFLTALTITTTFFYSIGFIKDHSINYFKTFKDLLFESSFWFIPSQFISFIILALLVNRIKQIYLGVLLFLMLLFLTVKFVYVTPLPHTNLLFSLVFVFYYWLGTVFKKLDLVPKIMKMRLDLILVAWFMCFILLNFETFMLWKINYPYINNNLRFSNQLYAIISFILLIRISNCFKISSIINPRTESFGVYLYQWLIIPVIVYCLRKLINLNDIGFLGSISYSIICFILTYTLTTALVKSIKNFKFFNLMPEEKNSMSFIYRYPYKFYNKLIKTA